MLILRAADLAQALVVELQHVLAVDQDLTGGGLVQPVEHPHQRRLPEPESPMTTKTSPGRHVERDVAHGGDAAGLLQELGPGEVASGDPTMRSAFGP